MCAPLPADAIQMRLVHISHTLTQPPSAVPSLTYFLQLRGFRVLSKTTESPHVRITFHKAGKVEMVALHTRRYFSISPRLQLAEARASAVLVFLDHFLDILPIAEAKYAKQTQKKPLKPKRSRRKKARKLARTRAALVAKKPPKRRLQPVQIRPIPRKIKRRELPPSPFEIPNTSHLVTFPLPEPRLKEPFTLGDTPWCELSAGAVWSYQQGAVLGGLSLMFQLRLKHISFHMEADTQFGKPMRGDESLIFLRPSLLIGWLPFSDWGMFEHRWSFRFLFGLSPFFLGASKKGLEYKWEILLGSTAGLQLDWYFHRNWALYVRPALILNFESPRPDQFNVLFQFSLWSGISFKF